MNVRERAQTRDKYSDSEDEGGRKLLSGAGEKNNLGRTEAASRDTNSKGDDLGRKPEPREET